MNVSRKPKETWRELIQRLADWRGCEEAVETFDEHVVSGCKESVAAWETISEYDLDGPYLHLTEQPDVNTNIRGFGDGSGNGMAVPIRYGEDDDE